MASPWTNHLGYAFVPLYLPTTRLYVDVLKPFAGSRERRHSSPPTLPPVEAPTTMIGSESQTSGHSKPWPAWILDVNDVLSSGAGLATTHWKRRRQWPRPSETPAPDHPASTYRRAVISLDKTHVALPSVTAGATDTTGKMGWIHRE